MATVTHLGLFPWCVPQSTKQLAQYLSENNSPVADYIAEIDHPRDNIVGWPVKLTLAQIMKLYWRVKTVRVAAPEPSVFTVGQVVSSAASEKDLVCHNFDEEIDIIADRPDNDGDDFLDNFGGALLALSWSFTIYDPEEDRFYMNMVASFGSVVDPLAGGSTIRVTDGQPVGGQIDFFGAQLTLYTPLGVDSEIGEITPLTYAAGSITAEEYWPYDPEDGGGPIYDSVTGERLRDYPLILGV